MLRGAATARRGGVRDCGGDRGGAVWFWAPLFFDGAVFLLVPSPPSSQAYESIGRIGEGTYGVVLRCKHRASGELVAVKRFKEASDESNAVSRAREGVAWGFRTLAPRPLPPLPLPVSPHTPPATPWSTVCCTRRGGYEGVGRARHSGTRRHTLWASPLEQFAGGGVVDFFCYGAPAIGGGAAACCPSAPPTETGGCPAWATVEGGRERAAKRGTAGRRGVTCGVPSLC